MATAVQPTTEPRTPNPRARLVLASVLGAVFVAAGIAVAAYLVPMLWRQAVSPVIAPFGAFVDVALRLAAQLAAVVGVVWLGTRLVGDNPPRGLRGGIFLVLALLLVAFLVVRLAGLNLQDTAYGLPATVVTLGVLLGLGYRFLMSPRAERWMVAIEEQGWFHAFNYKRTQGIRVRRYTLVGILLVGWSGVYSIIDQEAFGRGSWTMAIPFTGDPNAVVTPLSDVEYSVPLLLAALSLWVAWRAVNIPTFADFLIATEAEMNKVSWSSRKALVRDTIVVLATTVLMTLFLLVVDLFWGWLLSAVRVLPPQGGSGGTPAGQVDPALIKKADY